MGDERVRPQRFGHGRTLLAGDAAHAVPVVGGLNMNAGIADVHNRCWKLARVLHDWAGPGLPETYETERLSVARRTLAHAVEHTQLMLQAQKRRRAQRASGDAASARTVLRPARPGARHELPLGRRPHRRRRAGRTVRHGHGLRSHRPPWAPPAAVRPAHPGP
ncbi:FAD-dependent monooxygenase, partial [Streptomyces sp. 8K308]|uniref:FAD-dependent monooxygenase n=1 Tax=Streptomyces sp. 8K308 TaxID=2530388 RepID=UPI003264A997